MDDAEFVDFCYKRILGRPPDDRGRDWYERALARNEVTRESVLVEFLTSEEFDEQYRSREFVATGNFYSAVPSAETREAFIRSAPADVRSVPGIEIRDREQMALLDRFRAHYQDCPFPEQQGGECRYFFENAFYSYTDALVLYSMMREFRPSRIVEIGSGFSSAVMLDTADRFLDGAIDLTFIEPYPDTLRSLFRPGDERHAVYAANLQDVGSHVFKDLDTSDILFVDSTHVSKLGSDVNRIFFEILPGLRPGVLIHVHDIFWPFEYPKAWIEEGRSWNEAYMLRAFLEYNSEFEIVLFSDYVHRFHGEWIEANMPLYRRNTGGNLWLRRVDPK